jgi:hypothetical protein
VASCTLFVREYRQIGRQADYHRQFATLLFMVLSQRSLFVSPCSITRNGRPWFSVRFLILRLLPPVCGVVGGVVLQRDSLLYPGFPFCAAYASLGHIVSFDTILHLSTMANGAFGVDVSSLALLLLLLGPLSLSESHLCLVLFHGEAITRITAWAALPGMVSGVVVALQGAFVSLLLSIVALVITRSGMYML